MKSFHAHIYFDPAQQAAAAGLHQLVAGQLPVWVGRLHAEPIGPHPKGMFQLAFTAAHLAEVVIWLMQHRGELDVLIHGETGDDLLDHTQHVMWLGNSQPLLLDKL
jgi:aromatic ring-cleaving dioxygenase